MLIMECLSKYLKLFWWTGEDGASLLPDGALVPPQCPEEGLLLVGVPQEHSQTAGPHKLVWEEQAEGSNVGPQLRAQETGSLIFRLWTGFNGQVVPKTLREQRFQGVTFPGVWPLKLRRSSVKCSLQILMRTFLTPSLCKSWQAQSIQFYNQF